MLRKCPAAILAAVLASASPAMANVVLYVGNNTSANGDPLTSFTHATSAASSWAASLAGTPVYRGDLAAQSVASYPSGTSLSFSPAPSATLGASALSVRNAAGVNGQYATLGTTDNYFLSYVDGIEFQFNQALSGFSLFMTDLGDVASETVTMTLLSGGTTVATLQVTCVGTGTTNCVPVGTGIGQSGAVSFIGVTDTTRTFDTVRFTGAATDAVGYDNIEVAAPEPASVAALGSGLLALLALRHKRAL